MSEPTLKPCPLPWCESNAVGMDNLWGGWAVSCSACGLHGPTEDSQEQAAAAWNTRHVDPATLALARLGAAVVQTMPGAQVTPLVGRYWRTAGGVPNIDARITELLEGQA